jgi:hypothetical protein
MARGGEVRSFFRSRRGRNPTLGTRAGMSRKGGERAYTGRLVQDRSPRHCGHSTASAKLPSQPEAEDPAAHRGRLRPNRRLAGYEDLNDAERLRNDPAMRWIVGGKAAYGCAASPSQMGAFRDTLAHGRKEPFRARRSIWPVDRPRSRSSSAARRCARRGFER